MKPVLCIPSYTRPDGIAIERCKELPMEKFLFIRKSQLEMYRHWAPWYHIVLQTGGTDIGLVRNNILRYCHSHGYEWAFMLDDDIAKVEMLGKKPDGTMTAQRIIDGIAGPRMEIEAFKTWFKIAKKWDLAISSPNHRAYDRFSHGLLRVNKSAIIQCVLINTSVLMTLGGYKSIHETGNEDYYVQFKAMSNGLLTGKIGLLEYDCPAVGAGKGGNNTDEYTDINAKYNGYVETFLRTVCDNPQFVTTKTTSGGQKSIQFVWKTWGGFEKSLL